MRIRTHSNPLNCLKRFDKTLNDLLKDLNINFNYKGIDLEIGFGQAPFIINHANRYKEKLIVGVEVRHKTVEVLQEKLTLNKIENVLALHGTGQTCLQDLFDDNSLDNIFIFHPDPWFKRRHNNRRVVNQNLLEVAVKKLNNFGRIYISTDVEELWIYMLQEIEKNKNFKIIDDNNFWQNFYSTRWTDISKSKNKEIFYGTFELNPGLKSWDKNRSRNKISEID